MSDHECYDIPPEMVARAKQLPVHPWEVTHVVYHGQCRDGFAAAMAAHLANATSSRKTVFIPAVHGDPVPDFRPMDVVAILDFSWSREQLVELRGKVAGLVVIDHHKSSMEALAGLNFAWFDMTRSGCAMAWAYFMRGGPARCRSVMIKEYPLMFRYIEDRDMWQWRMLCSRYANAGIAELPLEFDAWEAQLENSEIETDANERGSWTVEEKWIDRGATITNHRDKAVDRICKDSWIGNIDGHPVPMVITDGSYCSEVGNKLCKQNPELMFSAVGYYIKGVLKWSLRSANGFDVSKVAARFPGGGGHLAAAGFTDTKEQDWKVKVHYYEFQT